MCENSTVLLIAANYLVDDEWVCLLGKLRVADETTQAKALVMLKGLLE